MVVTRSKAYGHEPDPHVVETFTQVPQDAQRRGVRRLHGRRAPLPQLAHPDRPARRLRTRPDHRRLPARRSVWRGPADRAQAGREARARRRHVHRRDHSRSRGARASRFARSRSCRRWPPATGSTSRARRPTPARPSSGSTSAIWAPSRNRTGRPCRSGRASTFLDIYFARDLASGILSEAQAQEIVDDFVIKLRIVRFLRTPEYDELFAGDPTWVTESIGGMGDDGRTLVTKTSFRFLQTLYNLGPAPEPNLTIWYSPRLPDGIPQLRGQGGDRHQRHPIRKRRDHAARLGRRRRDRLLRLAHAGGQADAVLRRSRQPRQVSPLRHQRRPRRNQRRADRPGARRGRRRLSRLRRRASNASKR